MVQKKKVFFSYLKFSLKLHCVLCGQRMRGLANRFPAAAFCSMWVTFLSLSPKIKNHFSVLLSLYLCHQQVLEILNGIHNGTTNKQICSQAFFICHTHNHRSSFWVSNRTNSMVKMGRSNDSQMEKGITNVNGS